MQNKEKVMYKRLRKRISKRFGFTFDSAFQWADSGKTKPVVAKI